MQSQNRAGFTQRILNIDWSKSFPLSLETFSNPDKIAAKTSFSAMVLVSDHSEVREFMRKNASLIFERDRWQSRFFSEEYTQTKSKYYEEVGDFFIFSVQDRNIGAFVGNVLDWSTYYLRSCAILPEYQGRGYLSIFLKHFLSVLKAHGIDRAETEVSPSNIGEIHLFNKFQFNMTGHRVSERWGATIQYTKFLNPSCEEAFLTRFCDGVRPQLTETPANVAAREQKAASKPKERGIQL